MGTSRCGEPLILGNTVGVASRASTVHVGGGVDGGGVGDDTVSIPSGTSTIVIGGDFLST